MTTALTIPLGTDYTQTFEVFDPRDASGATVLDITDWDPAGQIAKTNSSTSKASFTFRKLTQSGKHVLELTVPRASNTSALLGTSGVWDIELTKNRDTGGDNYLLYTRIRPILLVGDGPVEGKYTTLPEVTETDPTGTATATTTYVLRVEQQSGANFDAPLSTAGELDAYTSANAPKRLENSPAVLPPTGKLVVYQADGTAVSVDYTAA